MLANLAVVITGVLAIFAFSAGIATASRIYAKNDRIGQKKGVHRTATQALCVGTGFFTWWAVGAYIFPQTDWGTAVMAGFGAAVAIILPLHYVMMAGSPE